MKIEQAHEATDELLRALERLVPQLSPGLSAPSREHLEALLASPACQLLTARDPGAGIVGILTLVAYPLPSGWRWWIEDVVVDHSARGRGTGEALVREALARARAGGATAVNLTSNPTRAAANRLYPRLGFQRRDTNTYRLVF